jgi:hypothetical protein
MNVWQATVVSAVALFTVGVMSIAVVRLFSRRASGKAILRRATRFESALVGATLPDGAEAFDGWSYRVGARFAGRVRVVIHGDRVAVAGPRVPRALYEVWIWFQALTLALVPPALAAAAVMLEWRWLLAAAAFFVLSWMVSMGGAGLWPGLGELPAVEDRHFGAFEFPKELIGEVDIGKGWSKGGLGFVLLPYRAGVDMMAAARAVSFFAPDEGGREVRFALHTHSDEEARELAGILSSGESG